MRSRVCWSLVLSLFPGLLLAQARSMKEADFTSASECGTCHQDIYSQWTQSMHSQSLKDPVYRAVVDEMISRTGGAQKVFCLSCHAPVASVSGKLLNLPVPLRWEEDFSPVAAEGVTCDFCHTISGEENLGRNISVGSYVYPRQGTTAVKYGRHADARTDHHGTRVSNFLTSAELCAVCHKFKHPVQGVEIQSTYQEWLEGPYSRRGIRCQDCHMPAYSGRTAAGGQYREQIHAHVFIGGHTQMIQKAATVSVWGVLDQQAGGSKLNVTTTVRNSGAGHSIPTGIPGIREIGLQVEVLGPTGERLGQERFRYGQRLMTEAGSPALPWETFAILENNRIEPDETKEARFGMMLPPSLTGEVTIRARLFLHLIAEAMGRRLKIPLPPPALMASAESRVTID